MKKIRLCLLGLCCVPFVCFGQVSGQSNTNSSLSGQAQVFMQLQQMQNQITQLQGKLEEQELLIKQLQKEGLDRYQELDRRLSASPSTNNTPSNLGVINAETPLSKPTTDNTTPIDPEKEKVYYDAAFGLIKQKDYPNAVKAFNAFLNKFPQSQYAGNAQYWLAEVYLAQGNKEAAAENFGKVLQQYPKHPKVPDAIYKLANVQQRLGNKSKAKELFNQLVTKYPNTSAATLAKQGLQSLN